MKKQGMLLVATLWACGGGGEKAADQPPARDLSLAPAESTAKLNDRPMETAQPKMAAQPQRPAAKSAPARTPTTAQPQPKQPPAPAVATVAEGTTVDLVASDTITSRHHKKGDPIIATAGAAVRDPSGRPVIPAGAVFSGTISDIAPAEHPGGQGRIVLTFSRVSFGGKNYAVQARVDTVGTYMKGRGVTAGDAAKVGAATAIGAVAGRLLGGNKKGTAIGAAAGAAAGTGYAAATRDIDIILPAGALIRITLTAPFKLEPIAE